MAAAELESGGIGAHRQDVPRGLVPPELTANPVNATRGCCRAFCRAAARWLLETGERLGADSGFVTYDVLDAVVSLSAWEIVTQVAPAERDFTRNLRGFGWGTLLSAYLAEAVGGAAALGRVPGATVVVGPGGQVWRLGEDGRGVRDPARQPLRDAVAVPRLTGAPGHCALALSRPSVRGSPA